MRISTMNSVVQFRKSLLEKLMKTASIIVGKRDQLSKSQLFLSTNNRTGANIEEPYRQYMLSTQTGLGLSFKNHTDKTC